MSQGILKSYLMSALNELNRLTEHIRQTDQISQENELYFLLRELIQEQIGPDDREDTRPTNHQTR
jgi:hypothetical protein